MLVKKAPAIKILLSLLICVSGTSYSQVVNGEIDLAGTNIDSGEVISLSGDWKFYPGVFEPDSMDKNDFILIKTPGVWPMGDKIKKFGAGIYHLHVKNGGEQRVALKLGTINTAYRLWVNDELKALVGNPGPLGYRPELKPQTVPFHVSGDFDIYLLVSNFTQQKGGVYSNVYLGKADVIQRTRERDLTISVFLLAVILSITIYSLVMYFFDSGRNDFLYFTLFCLCAFMRGLAINEMPVKVLFPSISHDTASVLRYAGFILSVGFIGLYQKRIFKTRFTEFVSNIFIVISLLATVTIIATPVWVHSYISLAFQFITLAGIVCIYYQFLKILKQADSKLIMLMIGFTGIVVVFVHDVIAANGLTTLNYWQMYGFAGYAVIQAIYFGARYKTLNETIRSLHSNLTEYGVISKQKNEFEQTLITELQSLGQNITNMDDKSLLQEIARKISNPPELSTSHKVTLENLEKFNADFLYQLKKKHPDLTITELELCTCIKAKLTNKEISNLRNISPDSVKKAKTRLRKKMGLDPKTNFNTYLDKVNSL